MSIYAKEISLAVVPSVLGSLLVSAPLISGTIYGVTKYAVARVLDEVNFLPSVLKIIGVAAICLVSVGTGWAAIQALGYTLSLWQICQLTIATGLIRSISEFSMKNILRFVIP